MCLYFLSLTSAMTITNKNKHTLLFAIKPTHTHTILIKLQNYLFISSFHDKPDAIIIRMIHPFFSLSLSHYSSAHTHIYIHKIRLLFIPRALFVFISGWCGLFVPFSIYKRANWIFSELINYLCMLFHSFTIDFVAKKTLKTNKSTTCIMCYFRFAVDVEAARVLLFLHFNL